MVTAATTASSVSPPLLRMFMPLPRAFTPLADEMMTGRFAPVSADAKNSAALGDSPFEGSELANSLSAPASALPASVVAKNFRRVQRSMWILLWFRVGLPPCTLCQMGVKENHRPRLGGGERSEET